MAAAWLKIEVRKFNSQKKRTFFLFEKKTITFRFLHHQQQTMDLEIQEQISNPNKRWFHHVNESFSEKQLGG